MTCAPLLGQTIENHISKPKIGNTENDNTDNRNRDKGLSESKGVKSIFGNHENRYQN